MEVGFNHVVVLVLGFAIQRFQAVSGHGRGYLRECCDQSAQPSARMVLRAEPSRTSAAADA